MVAGTIHDMNKQLTDLSQFFQDSTTRFVTVIKAHEARFTPGDYEQFRILLAELREYVISRLSAFLDGKLEGKTQIYEDHIDSFASAGDNVQRQLVEFRKSLTDATIELKANQNHNEQLLEHFSQRFSEHAVLRRVWKCLADNKFERQAAKLLDQRSDEIYRHNLKKKAFFPWRRLSYKEGHEQTVRRETEKDIGCIHEQYQSIIEVLKTKIAETDEAIRVKKAAKGEFAFSLNKNLLKSISNLSLEVMSLNQMSLRDGQTDQTQTREFMRSVDRVIKEKLEVVARYRKGLNQQDNEESSEENEHQRKKKKHISFA